MSGERRRSSALPLAIATAVALTLGATGSPGHDGHGPYVDEYPDDPYVCGGAIDLEGWCEFHLGGAPITVEMDFETFTLDGEVDASRRIEVHAEIRIMIPETEWGVLVAECVQGDFGTASCSAAMLDGPVAVPLPETYPILCAAHAHVSGGQFPLDGGRFLCKSGA